MKKIEILQYLQNTLCDSEDCCTESVGNYLSDWLNNIRLFVAPSTFSGYKLSISNISKYFDEKETTLGALSAADIQAFYDDLLRNGKSASTVLHYHANIHKALKAAVKSGLIYINPADYVELPKKSKYNPSFYSEDELKALLLCAKHEDIRVCVFVAAYYGLRRSEVIGLKWTAIDFRRKTISIENKIVEIIGEDGHYFLNESPELKNSSSRRILPLIPEIEKILLEERARQSINRKLCSNYNCAYDNYICRHTDGTLITPNCFSSHFEKMLKKYHLRKIRLHDLRHTCASLLLMQGISMKQIQDWLGHSNFSTTANIYAHLDYTSKKETAVCITEILK